MMSMWTSAVSTLPEPPTEPRRAEGSVSSETNESQRFATNVTVNLRISNLAAKWIASPV